MKTDDELITYFGTTRNLKKSTIDSYTIYIREYSRFNDKTMVELLEEQKMLQQQLQEVQSKLNPIKTKTGKPKRNITINIP